MMVTTEIGSRDQNLEILTLAATRRANMANVKAWEVERDRAEILHKRPSSTKPTLKGQLFSAVPKPAFGASRSDDPSVSGPSNKATHSGPARSKTADDSGDDTQESEEDSEESEEDRIESDEEGQDSDE
ncbi:hypothetical protein B0H13DRAFT_1858757 [Mycena leptocephala]|nr:hypothetical protein B0H13DRAFT_1858757 [Mycena leptocephala]